MNSSAVFETDFADRHLTSLCNHFSRKVEASCDAGKGQVRFPFGQCEMTADEQSLVFVATAQDQANLDLVMQIVTSHLDRFAFRENPHLVWKAAMK